MYLNIIVIYYVKLNNNIIPTYVYISIKLLLYYLFKNKFNNLSLYYCIY